MQRQADISMASKDALNTGCLLMLRMQDAGEGEGGSSHHLTLAIGFSRMTARFVDLPDI